MGVKVKGQAVTYSCAGLEQNSRGQFQHRLGRPTDSNAPRQQTSCKFANPIALVHENCVNRPPHAQRVDGFTGRNPESVPRF